MVVPMVSLDKTREQEMVAEAEKQQRVEKVSREVERARSRFDLRRVSRVY